uniref:Uncharacterized protein n=1 Tax=Sinocyclocheilus grahami TaxID=75366 RepID=A0A672KXD3_SINGR
LMLFAHFIFFVKAIHEIKSDGVVILCSGGEDGAVSWVKGKNGIAGQTNATLEVKADQGRVEGFYSCKYGDITHVFYLRVQVCENCYELSRVKATVIIFGDLLITGVVILIIFIISNKNSGGTHKRVYGTLHTFTRSSQTSGLLLFSALNGNQRNKYQKKRIGN